MALAISNTPWEIKTSSNSRRHLLLFSFSFLLLFLSCSPSQSSGSSLIPIGLRLLPLTLLGLTWFFLYGRAANTRLNHVLSLFVFTAYLIAINLYSFSFLVVIFIVVVWSAALVVILLNNNRALRKVFLDVCSLLLMIWIASIVVQVLSFLTLGAPLHLHNLIFPYSHARAHVGLNYARFSGTQVEPGTYSNWVYGIVIIRALMLKKIASRLHISAVISTLFTMSAWAYFAVPFFLLSLLLEGRDIIGFFKKLFFLLMLGAGTAMLLYQKVSSYLEYRFLGSGGTHSTSGKLDVYNFMISHFSDWFFHGVSLNTIPCSFCESPQDAGVGVNALIYLGIPGILVVFYLLIRLYGRLRMAGIMLLVPIFFAKYYIFDPVTCLIVFMIFQYSETCVAARIVAGPTEPQSGTFSVDDAEDGKRMSHV